MLAAAGRRPLSSHLRACRTTGAGPPPTARSRAQGPAACSATSLAQRYLHRTGTRAIASWRAGWRVYADRAERQGDPCPGAAASAGRRAAARPTSTPLVPRAAADETARPCRSAPIPHRGRSPARRILEAEIRGLASPIRAAPSARWTMPRPSGCSTPTTSTSAHARRRGLSRRRRGREGADAGATAHGAAYAPLAHWDAGLAAWRLGRLGEARGHFETLARARACRAGPPRPRPSGRRASSCASRPARSRHLLARPRRRAAAHLLRPARPPHARASTPLSISSAEPFTDIDAKRCSTRPAGAARAGPAAGRRERRAPSSSCAPWRRRAPAAVPALVALADRANMPALSLQLAARSPGDDGRRHDHALYPVPRWTPGGGFTRRPRPRLRADAPGIAVPARARAAAGAHRR